MQHAPFALLSLLLPGCDATPVRIPPDPELADTGCARQLAISPAEIRFPLGPVGSDSAVTVTLENVGCHPISLDDLSFESSDAPFAISAVGSIVLPEGTQTSCQVTYEPNASGITEATMLIESDDPDSPDEVKLYAPVWGLELRQVDPVIDEVPVGCSAEASFELRNRSSNDVVVAHLEAEASSAEFSFDALEATNGTPPWTLSPGATMTFHGQYTPTDAAADSLRVSAWIDGEEWPSAATVGTAVGGWPEEVVESWGVPGPPVLDVLVVMDDSAAMAEEEASLEPALQWVFAELVAADADAQIAVITTHSAELRGALIHVADADAASNLRTQAAVGLAGMGGASGLSMAWDALQPSGEAGPGSDFLRADSTLHVVTVADGADAGPVHWRDFVTYALSLRTDAELLRVHAVNGDQPTGCATAAAGDGYYDAAIASDGVALSLCATDWGEPLASAVLGELADPSRYEVSKTPDEATLAVYVNGVERTTGWSYASVDRALVFSEGYVPEPGDVVELRYRVEADCDG